jgi:hypothetical protein
MVRWIYLICALLWLYPMTDQSLHPLQIMSVYIHRTPKNELSLTIKGWAEICGSEPFVTYVSNAETMYWNSYTNNQVIEIHLNILPDSSDCEADYLHTINLTEEFIEDRHYVILVNDFAAWIALGESAEHSVQHIDFGETELIRWQKIDSHIDSLDTVGASAERHVLWLRGSHPDDCNSTDVFAVLIPDITEDQFYRASVFQLFPENVQCTSTTTEFLLPIESNLWQSRAAYVEIGNNLYHYIPHDTWQVVKRFPMAIQTWKIVEQKDTFLIEIQGKIPAHCPYPVDVIQGNFSIHVFVEIPEDVDCGGVPTFVKQNLNVGMLPVVVNGVVIR